MHEARVVAQGLRFPEGPMVLPDGSLLVAEMGGAAVARIRPDDGSIERIPIAGGPNGLALGPDGKVYICNNGGYALTEYGPMLLPGTGEADVTQPEGYEGGSIQRLDLATGAVETLYTHCGDVRLRSPNDVVFDSAGGLWFTDHGKVRRHDMDRGVLYYATADGATIVEAAHSLYQPNGVGLSPDGSKVYVAETPTGRLWQWDVAAPGELSKARPFGNGGGLVAGVGGLQFFDSLGVEEGGNICVATIFNPGITVITPDGDAEHVPLPGELYDPVPTNIAWGGDDMRTAYITLSATGRVMSCRWPRPGLRLNY